MQRADCRVIMMWVCTDLYKLFVELLGYVQASTSALEKCSLHSCIFLHTLCLLDKEPAESLLMGSRTQDKDTEKF